MNIAIFTETYPPFINGVSTSCYNLAKTLREHGHRVIVVTARSTSGKLEFKDDIVYMPGLEMKKLYGYRMTKIFDRKVLKLLKDNNIELIHNQTDWTVGLFARRAAKALKVPIVYTYHTSYEDYTYYVTKGVLDRIAKRTIRFYSKTISKNATEFITPSVKTKDFARNVGYDTYINVIPSGIDFSIFKSDKIDQDEVLNFKREHHIDDDTKIILLLGRIAKEKSMDVSIRYFANYLKSHPALKMKMIVVGGGPQREELELLAHELNIASSIVFLGPKSASEVPFYYHVADIYTSASTTETQGLTFMEAMASGTIVLARYDDNLTDTIIDNQTGFFFTNESSFEDKMNRILALDKSQKDKIINGAYNSIAKYSIDRFYANIIGVYKRALKKFW